MDNTLIQPSAISIEQFELFKTLKITPIDIVNIPNITVPLNLVFNKRLINKENPVLITLRRIFHTITNNNIDSIADTVLNILEEQVKDQSTMEMVIDELFEIFLSNGDNIENYICVLDKIKTHHVPYVNKNDATQNNKPCERSLNLFFLNACGIKIFSMIENKNISNLAELKMYDDIESVDEYNAQMEKNLSLIKIVCILYKQNDKKKINLKPTQISSLLIKLIVYQDTISKDIKNIQEDDPNEDLYNNINYIIIKYLNQFMIESIKEFWNDSRDLSLRKIVEKFKIILHSVKDTGGYLHHSCLETLSKLDN